VIARAVRFAAIILCSAAAVIVLGALGAVAQILSGGPL
jgi:hypothetical protein